MSSGHNLNMTDKTTSKQAFFHSCLHDYIQFHVDTTGYDYRIGESSIEFDDVETLDPVCTYHKNGMCYGEDIILNRKDKCMISVLYYMIMIEESL